jgi:hypothetical protein
MSKVTAAVESHQWDTARKRMGAWSELSASAHLLARGFDVYRSVSPAAAFDLVAHRDGQLLRVEVKTVSRPRGISWCPAFGWPVNDEWDLVLIVAPDVVFEFHKSATREDARDAIRAHYEVQGRPKSETLSDRVLAQLRCAPDIEWTARAMCLAVEGPHVQHVRNALAGLAGEGKASRVRPGVYRLSAA